MKSFVGGRRHRTEPDQEALDWRDKAKLSALLLLVGAFMLAGEVYSETFYLALYALIAVAYAVQKVRLWKRERAKAPTGEGRSSRSR